MIVQRLAACCLLAAAMTHHATAAILLDDPFTAATRSNATGGDTSGGIWYHISSTGTVLKTRHLWTR